MRIFAKDEGEYVRYWASVSTEKVDKKNKGTGEYARANIPVRLSASAVEAIEDGLTKTKNKAIKTASVKVKKAWLKAAEPKDGEPFVLLFINELELAEDEERIE